MILFETGFEGFVLLQSLGNVWLLGVLGNNLQRDLRPVWTGWHFNSGRDFCKVIGYLFDHLLLCLFGWL